MYREEPLPPSHPFLELDNVVLSPHVGYNTPEATVALHDIAVECLARYFSGRSGQRGGRDRPEVRTCRGPGPVDARIRLPRPLRQGHAGRSGASNATCTARVDSRFRGNDEKEFPSFPRKRESTRNDEPRPVRRQAVSDRGSAGRPERVRAGRSAAGSESGPAVYRTLRFCRRGGGARVRADSEAPLWARDACMSRIADITMKAPNPTATGRGSPSTVTATAIAVSGSTLVSIAVGTEPTSSMARNMVVIAIMKITVMRTTSATPSSDSGTRHAALGHQSERGERGGADRHVEGDFDEVGRVQKTIGHHVHDGAGQCGACREAEAEGVKGGEGDLERDEETAKGRRDGGELHGIHADAQDRGGREHHERRVGVEDDGREADRDVDDGGEVEDGDHEAEDAKQQHRPENSQAQPAKSPVRREPDAEYQDEGDIAQQRETGGGEAVLVGEPGEPPGRSRIRRPRSGPRGSRRAGAREAGGRDGRPRGDCGAGLSAPRPPIRDRLSRWIPAFAGMTSLAPQPSFP